MARLVEVTVCLRLGGTGETKRQKYGSSSAHVSEESYLVGSGWSLGQRGL